MEANIKVEAGTDLFEAWSDELFGVTACGTTLDEMKKNLLECIELNKQIGNIKNVDYQLVYHYDTQSFLRHYSKVFTMVALERLTGIHQKQLHHYIMGRSTPRQSTREKIQKALHDLGAELLAFRL